MSAWVAARRPRSRSVEKAGPPVEQKTMLPSFRVRLRAGLRACRVTDAGAQGDLFLDHRRIETHPVTLDVSACGSQDFAQRLVQHLHAQFRQHPQGRGMDVFYKLSADNFERGIGAGKLGPALLMDGTGLAGAATAPPFPRRATAGFNAHSRWLSIFGSPVKLFPYFLDSVRSAFTSITIRHPVAGAPAIPIIPLALSWC